MAGIKKNLVTVNSTSFPATPQLDAGTMRGTMTFAHMTAGGVPLEVSLDGKEDHGTLDPSTGVITLNFEFPYYSKAWVRTRGPGAAQAQIICEGI